MRRYGWLKWLVGGLLILAAVYTLPRYIKTLRLNRRIQDALSFPSEGYSEDHASLVLKAMAKAFYDSDNPIPTLVVNVVVTNTGQRTIKDIIAAAKTDHLKKYCFYGTGSLRVWMLGLTLEPGREPPASLGFARTTPLRTLEQGEFEQLVSMLGEPLLVKLVHDQGTELLLVKPDFRIEIQP